MKKYIYLGIIILVSLLLFIPSFSTFYTNDDFFLLKISQAGNLSQFANFFNFVKGPEGLGMYRPLTIQVFYFLANMIFKLNPLPMHVITFLVFVLVIYSVFLISKKILEIVKVSYPEKVALVSTFLYATSATHFGHMYYLATFQELGVTLFAVLSVYQYIKYLDSKRNKHLIFSIVCFALALLSKENAVIIPILFVLVFLLKKYAFDLKTLNVKRLAMSLIPFALILSAYCYFHFFVYGLATGDSYVWDFSLRKLFNTTAWYVLWSFNLPEMLVDFVGPGLSLNPNLLKYWSREIVPIFALFFLQVIVIVGCLFKNIKKNKNIWVLNIFLLLWFIVALAPVIFLPIHKFTFYLTLPLIGITILVSNLLSAANINRIYIIIFATLWLLSSYITLSLTRDTNWITRGAETSKVVYKYFQNNKDIYIDKPAMFYDTQFDKNLPFSPTAIVKTSLSDNNFFQVLFNGKIKAIYLNGYDNIGNIKSRQFIGY